MLPALAAAVMVGIGLSRRAAEPERLYAAVALPSVLAVLGSGVAVSSTYGIDGSTGLNERYVFSVVPLLLLGLALWIHAGLPRPRWALGRRGRVRWCRRCCRGTRSRSTPALRAVAGPVGRCLSAHRHGDRRRAVRARRGLVWLRCARERAGLTWVVTLTCCVARRDHGGAYASRAQTANDDSGEARRDWVDAAVPDGEAVTVVWEQPGATARDRAGRLDLGAVLPLMLTELFNPSIGPVHRLGAPTINENHLPTRGARVDDSGAVVAADGSQVAGGVVLAPCNMAVRGRRLAESADGAFGLWRTQRGIVAGASAPCPG